MNFDDTNRYDQIDGLDTFIVDPRTNDRIDRFLNRLFRANAPASVLVKRDSLLSLSDRLLKILPEECWMTEKTLANELGTTRHQIQNAKRYLLSTGRIVIDERSNINRWNPRHVIRKPAEIIFPKQNFFDNPTTIRWEVIEDLGLTPDYLNQLEVEVLLEIFQEMRMPFIPIHYPKERKSGLSCSCRSGKKCSSTGKHPVVRWKDLDFSEDSTYREMRAIWKERNNDFNVGILTNDFSVIDVDLRHYGHFGLRYLEEAYGGLPREMMVQTGNGFHIYVADRLRCSVGALEYSGIDIRSKGGYVIAPVSRHHSGAQYLWSSLSTPEYLPSELVEDLSLNVVSPCESRGPVQSIIENSEPIPEGQRAVTMFRIACSLRGQGSELESIYDFISEQNKIRCAVPLSDSEVMHAAKSACKYPTNASKLMALKP